MDRITLSEALATDRLADFVTQAEADGIGPANGAAFDSLVRRVTAPQPEDRTSHLPGRDGSRGR